VLQAGAEGRGFASEAAAAVRDHAFRALGWPTLVSYMDPENDRSVRLAERLGGVRDDAAARPAGPDECIVYRYPAPGAA
jgi:RimJ/RimL family protein N-acetyltransferase